MTAAITSDDSPFKVIRKKTGFTQVEFCGYANLSVSTMVYIEQGLYEHTPERPVQALMTLAAEKDVDVSEVYASFDARTLDAATVNYQRAYRKRAKKLIRPAYQAVMVNNTVGELESAEDSPLERMAILSFQTRDSFAKQLKVPPVVVRQFQVGDTRKLPGVLHTALLDAGLKDAEIGRFEVAQQAWVIAHAGVKQRELALVD